MTVPTLITQLNTSAASNSPAGGDSPVDGDNFFRALSAFIAQLRDQLNGTSAAGTLKTPVFTGTPTGTVTSAGYAPAAVGVSNVSAVSVPRAEYWRMGGFVMVTAYITLVPSAAGNGQFYIPLPVSSNFVNISDAAGVISGLASDGTAITGLVRADVSGDRLDCLFIGNTAVTADICIRANYSVL